MADRRIDRIARILENANGRARIRQVLEELRAVEDNDAVSVQSIYIAIQAENDRLESNGEMPRFRTSKHGEQRGWVSLQSRSKFTPGSPANRIERHIREANRKVDEEIRSRLQAMDWRTFESTFLVEVLEKLGFKEVMITQVTRDGGTDARVAYKRGIVEANAIVSAKKWSSRSVPVEEVRLMRGVQGNEDTAIIVTTGRFTADAQKEARPSQNQRVVYLIDGDRLVEICKQYKIGVETIQLPSLFVLDAEKFASTEEQEEAEEELTAEDDEGSKEQEDSDGSVQRLRVNMLGDTEKGISVSEIAELVGLQESSVRSYLSAPEKKAGLFRKIRTDPDIRSAALTLIRQKRGSAPLAADGGEHVRLQRLRTSMVGDPHRGLRVSDIADLLGLEESTVRTYLSDETRKAGLAQRIRDDEATREKALRIVAQKRSS